MSGLTGVPWLWLDFWWWAASFVINTTRIEEQRDKWAQFEFTKELARNIDGVLFWGGLVERDRRFCGF
jgi:hypothetical protein